jgi:hypothetical protein
MTISIDSNILLSYYDLKAGVPASATSGSGSATTTTASTSTAPVTPWARAATTAQTNSLVQSVLNGEALINPTTTKLSIPAGAPNYNNYKNLFALYQGLSALQDIATAANATGVSSYQLGQLQTAFTGGMSQLQSYLNTSPFTGFSVAEGAVGVNAQTSAGVPNETDTYNTGVLWSGDASTPVPAFAGNVQFSLTVTQTPLTIGNTTIQTSNTPPKVVSFNLNDMGSTPRTMSNVVSYLNAQLKAAGVATRFSDVLTQGTSTTYQVNGRTITNPPGPNTYSLQIAGNPVETLTFSAAATSPSVYITQTAGAVPTLGSASATTSSSTSGNTTTSGASGNVTQQLLKLTTDPSAANARVFTDTLGSEVQNAIATATAPDGSVYVLANIDASTQAGQVDSSHAISGTQDVALMKYDSAGNLVFTQTLGSTDSASGLGLAVSPDGSQVAVVGQGTGLLDDDGGAPPDATDPTGFVAVYDSSGDQVWTQAVNAWTGGQVNSVAFGADNSVYVAGSTAITSTVSDGFIAGFSSTGAQTFNTYLGPTTSSTVNGIAVSGSSLITAGVQNGDAVVQSYALQPSGAPVLSATQNLGSLNGGNVTGVGVTSNGSIVVAGSTQNGALDVGTIGSAYSGSGENAFVAALAGNLTPSSSDTLAYFAGDSDTTATALTVSGGEAYITGQIAATPTPSSGYLTANDGYAAQIDPTTGQVTWSNTFNTDNSQAAPDSISVDPTGASSLDALGLPTGTLSFTPNPNLLANTSLQAGEQFLVKSNFSALPQTVTISADDTLQTLAQKITQASGYGATVQVVTGANGAQQLQITPTSSASQITLEAGPSGENALTALGLSAGLITTSATAKAKSASTAGGAVATTSLKANYALGLEGTLNLNSTAGIQNALAQLGGAITAVKQIYTDMTTKPSTKTAGVNGPVPAYLTAEISSYQAALARLTSASSGSSSTLT